MLKKVLTLFVVVASAALAACGDDNSIFGPGSGGNPEVASVQVLAASTTLDSDQSGLTPLDITAIVRDANNVVLADVPVTFGASANGSISVIQLNTDANGQALAQLSSTDASNRTITVTAGAGSAAGSVNVNVIGTVVTIDCPDTVALSATATCIVKLEDSTDTGIPTQPVTVASSLNNGLSAASLVTDESGQASVVFTANNSGTDTLTASGLGDTGIENVVVPAVSGDSFSIITPANDGLEIPLNTSQPVTVAWLISGVPQNTQTMQFATSRGAFIVPGSGTPPSTGTPASSAVTAGLGQATLDIWSDTAGIATIAVIRPGGAIASRTVEFVATAPATVDVQAEPSSVRVGNQAQITAIVRDANGNPVKNKTVSFALSDNTGGSLSSPVATTGSNGKANIVYTAGASQSATDGVTVTATLQGTAVTPDSVKLTVTGQALAISLGTGNTLFELGTATFAKEWVIFVTDADGNAVAGKPVTVSIRSVNFKKGNLYVPLDGDAWVKQPVPASFDPLFCPDEDLNLNGILDFKPFVTEDEDLNNSGQLEAGNIALVAPVAAGASASAPCSNLASGGTSQFTVATGNDGRARVCVLYPENYNLWLDVRIQARASVQGTEFNKSSTFELEALADDITDINASPPGVVSPFGAVDTSPGALTPACLQPPPE